MHLENLSAFNYSHIRADVDEHPFDKKSDVLIVLKKRLILVRNYVILLLKFSSFQKILVTKYVIFLSKFQFFEKFC